VISSRALVGQLRLASGIGTSAVNARSDLAESPEEVGFLYSSDALIPTDLTHGFGLKAVNAF